MLQDAEHLHYFSEFLSVLLSQSILRMQIHVYLYHSEMVAEVCLGPFQKVLEEGQVARQDESSLPEGRTMFSRVLEVLGGAEGTMYLQLLIQQGAQD